MTRKGKNTARLALLNAAFILLCLVTLVPVLYALSISFSGQGAALSGDSVCTDGKIITAKGAGAALEFALALARGLKGDAAAQKIKETIQCSR